MTVCSLPKARPIWCNDCPAFQQHHMSVLCIAESLTRLRIVIHTTFRKEIYSRWCCIDRLSRQRFSECGVLVLASKSPLAGGVRGSPLSRRRDNEFQLEYAAASGPGRRTHVRTKYQGLLFS